MVSDCIRFRCDSRLQRWSSFLDFWIMCLVLDLLAFWLYVGPPPGLKLWILFSNAGVARFEKRGHKATSCFRRCMTSARPTCTNLCLTKALGSFGFSDPTWMSGFLDVDAIPRENFGSDPFRVCSAGFRVSSPFGGLLPQVEGGGFHTLHWLHWSQGAYAGQIVLLAIFSRQKIRGWPGGKDHSRLH